MKTIIKNYKGEEFEIETHFSHIFKGYGRWLIICRVSFKGHRRPFHSYTNDSMFIDKISDVRIDDASWEEIQNTYKEKFLDNLKESIIEWCEDINE